MNLVLSLESLPATLRTEELMSEQQLMDFCRANELVRIERMASGEILLMSPTGTETGGQEFDVAFELGLWARLDGRGRGFGSNTGFTLPDGSMRSPDAAWVSWARWNALTPEERVRFAPLCPEFVVEIRSASDRLTALQDKMLMWVSNGAEVAWLLDPESRTVWVYRLGEQVEVHVDPTSVQGTGPVRGFELVLARVWG